MKAKFKITGKRTLSMLITLIMVLSLCDAGVTPTSASTTKKDVADIGADADIGAINAQETYTLTLNSNDDSYGTVTGAGTYEGGSVVDIEAVPVSGYHFDNWTTVSGNSPADATAASTTVTLTQDTKLQANFVANTGSASLQLNGATIKINSSTIPATSGTTDLNFFGGTPMEISATKRAQKFIRWNITGATEGIDFALVDSSLTDATIRIIILNDGIHFTIKPIFSSTAHTVTFQDWDGTVINTQNVINGEAAIAPADPTRDNYIFTGWDKDYSSITEDTVITATYIPNKHNLTVNSGTGGTASAESTEVGHGNSTTITAIPDSGYAFIGWTVESGCAPADLSSASTTVTITEDTVLTANFKEVIVQATFESEGGYSYVYRTNEGSSGLVYSLSATLVPGDSISITSFRLKGGTFNKWVITGATEGIDYEFTSGSVYSEIITIRILDTARPDLTLLAKAYYSVTYYSVTFVDWDGTVLSTQSVSAGDSATAPADPTREGYTFMGWDKDFSVITENTQVNATYSMIVFSLTVNSGARGTALAEASSVAQNKPATIFAIPDYGYTFTGWTVNSGDTPADSSAPCTTVTITQDTVLTANFAKISSVSDHNTLFDLATSDAPYVYVNKDVFKLGEAVYTVADKGSWIGVYSLDVTSPTAEDTLYYSYSLTGNEGKAVDIKSGEKHTPLVPGNYVIYLFEDEGYNAIASDTFTIYNPYNSYDDSLNMILSSKADYTYGEAVHLTACTTSEYLSKAWVGVYPAGADYTATSAKYMYFVKNHLGETVNLIENSEINTGAKLSAGSYDIYLFGSEDFSTELVKITINVSGGTVSTNKDTYTTFPNTSKTEDVLTLAELYDADNSPINNYVTPTVESLRVYRYSDGTDALQSLKKGSPYRLMGTVSSGYAYVEYDEGKYGYCVFECLTRYEYSDVVIDGYIKIATTLYEDYDRETVLKTLDVNTPVSIIENDSSTVKIQVGGIIGYAEYYHISMTATPHTSDFATVDSGAWVGIFPADTVLESNPTSTAWYYTTEFWNKSVSLTTLAKGDGTSYRGTSYLPAGEYAVYLFGDNGYTNILDSTTFTVTEGDYCGAFVNGTYEVENLTDGFANGTVTLETNPDYYGFLSIADAVLYWADAQGNHLTDYNSLARQHINTPVFSFDMYSHTIIPEGAAYLMAYMSCGTINSTASFSIDLPEECATFDDLDESILSEFQIVSDLHITSDEVTAYPNGQGLINEWYHVNSNWFYQLLLYDVTAHSPNSSGIFVNGDIANNGLAEEYANIGALSSVVESEDRPYPIPQMYVNMGNHDSYPGNIDAYINYATSLGAEITKDKPYYSKMVNGYKYIFLAGDNTAYYGLHDAADHDSAEISSAQLEWLDAELLDNEQNNAGKPVFVMVHQAVPDSVAGSLSGQWGYNYGIKNHEELTDVLNDYNNVILLSGHSHWELDAEGNLNPGSEDISVAVNTASIGYLWTDYSGVEGYISGTQGFYVRIYKDKVVLLGRDFYNHKWMPSACYVIYNEDVSAKFDKKVLPLGDELNASEYITNTKGRTLTFESSDSSVVTVDENGKLTAVSKGTAVITVNAAATNTEVVTREKIQIIVPETTTATITYLYNDRKGNEQTYLAVHNLSDDEILGFEGNNFTPYAPSYISGDGWTNSVLINSPNIILITEDITWAINDDTYNTNTYVLKATQTDRLFTITSQVGETVKVYQKVYGDNLSIDARQLDQNISSTGFWYNDTDNDGKYTDGTDLILTYGPYYAYRVTCDMNINYEEADKFDFNINIDSPAYGRTLTSSADGSVTDKVTADYVINILTPYFYGSDNNFVPTDNIIGNPEGQHVTIESLRNAGYTVNFGVLFEQVGSFAPGSTAYPTFEDALTAAKAANYGVATSKQTLVDIVENYTAPTMSAAGTYCTLYDCSNYSITNKNRFGFTIKFNNTEANHKKFFNVYSYLTVTTPDNVTTTYLSNVQTLNIYTAGTADNS